MANSNARYFSIKSPLKTGIKSHATKEKAILAAGSEGYIFDRMLEIQMHIIRDESGELVADLPPNNNFDFKNKLMKENIISSLY